jgi:hypothetical protein
VWAIRPAVVSDLKETGKDLILPICRIITSPLFSINGYMEVARKHKYPIAILFGSLTLFIISGLLQKYQVFSSKTLLSITNVIPSFKN